MFEKISAKVLGSSTTTRILSIALYIGATVVVGVAIAAIMPHAVEARPPPCGGTGC